MSPENRPSCYLISRYFCLKRQRLLTKRNPLDVVVNCMVTGKKVSSQADMKSRGKPGRLEVIVNHKIVFHGCVLKLIFLSDEERIDFDSRINELTTVFCSVFRHIKDQRKFL